MNKNTTNKKAVVDEETCISCNICVITCPHQALYMASNNKARVNPDLCKACGECVVVCPVSCISIKEMINKSKE